MFGKRNQIDKLPVDVLPNKQIIPLCSAAEHAMDSLHCYRSNNKRKCCCKAMDCSQTSMSYTCIDYNYGRYYHRWGCGLYINQEDYLIWNMKLPTSSLYGKHESLWCIKPVFSKFHHQLLKKLAFVHQAL